MNLRGSPLTDADLVKLAKCGISAELAETALLRRVDSQAGAEIVGRNGNADYSGVLFPYVWPGEDRVREYRLRRDHPELEAKPEGSHKERNKYLSPPGRGNMLYFCPGTDPAWLDDMGSPIIITEGEKKCLALSGLGWHELGDMADYPRWLSIGLSGVWNWKGTIGKAPGPGGDRRDVKGPIPDLSRITWDGRGVLIVFDRNVLSKDSVAAARRELARELSKRGALVDVIDLPEFDGNGIDDLIGLWGADRVLELLKTAARPWNAKPSSEGLGRRTIQRIEDLPRVEDVGSATIQWDVEGFIPSATVVLFTGESGAGKSTFVAALAYAVSKGKPFLGRQTIKRPVLILDAENPSVAVRERFQRLGIETDEHFFVWGQWVPDDPPAAGGTVVSDWIARCDPKPVIVVDSFIRFHPGAENDASETQKYMGMYRKLAAAGATVIVLHHVGKSDTAQDYRGSSDIKASVDIAYKLTNFGDGTRLSLLDLRAFKQRISVAPHLKIRYEGGQFVTDQREAVKTVPEQLIELLRQNPGIMTRPFEALVAKKKLRRKRGREFLEGGIRNGTIRLQTQGRKHYHFWLEDGLLSAALDPRGTII